MEIGSEEFVARLNVRKNQIVTGLFVDTADQDYVAARWAFQKRLFNIFFWCAGQCLEKYMKAALLLNGESVHLPNARGGHDLLSIFDRISYLFDEFLPRTLCKPNEVTAQRWKKEAPLEFLTRIDRFVDPHNRYGTYGIQARTEDFFHLDQMVFALRRLAFRLDCYPFLGPRAPEVPREIRDLLRIDPLYQPRGIDSRLGKILSSAGNKVDPELRHSASNYNFLFSDSEYPHDDSFSPSGWSSNTPVLYTALLEHFERDSKDAQAGVTSAAVDWVVANIMLPKTVVEQLLKAKEKGKERP